MDPPPEIGGTPKTCPRRLVIRHPWIGTALARYHSGLDVARGDMPVAVLDARATIGDAMIYRREREAKKNGAE